MKTQPVVNVVTKGHIDYDKVGASDLDDLLVCECGDTADIKPVQFRNGWGKNANGYFAEIHNICKTCRNSSWGSWRNAH